MLVDGVRASLELPVVRPNPVSVEALCRVRRLCEGTGRQREQDSCGATEAFLCDEMRHLCVATGTVVLVQPSDMCRSVQACACEISGGSDC